MSNDLTAEFDQERNISTPGTPPGSRVDRFAEMLPPDRAEAMLVALRDDKYAGTVINRVLARWAEEEGIDHSNVPGYGSIRNWRKHNS
jgi:hypothetical protein